VLYNPFNGYGPFDWLVFLAIAGLLYAAFGRNGDFLGWLDLSENLERAFKAVRGTTGRSAMISGIAFLAIASICGGLAYYFDLESTYDWLAEARRAVESSYGLVSPQWAVMVGTLVSLFPTLLELFGARLARAGITFIEWLVYAFIVFDFITDLERSALFVQTYIDRGALLWAGPFAGGLGIAAKLVMTLIASLVMEMAFILFLAAGIVLILNAMKGAPETGRGDARTAGRA
jgi:hypothetical protein